MADFAEVTVAVSRRGGGGERERERERDDVLGSNAWRSGLD
jgi:hypothetical protein